MKKRFLLLCLLLPGFALPARAFEVTAFQIRNNSPLVQIFGLPAGGDARLPAGGDGEGRLTAEVASHFTDDSADGERIYFDGETYRYSLQLQRRFGKRLAFGLEIPYLQHRGGFLDAFIEGWHDTFGLPQGGRDRASRDRLLFLYTEDGRDRVRIDEGAEGIGDIRLHGAWQLQASAASAAALHAELKLPTGDSDELLGSGSTDLALWLAGEQAAGDTVSFFAGAGALFLTDGDVLADRQRHLAGFARLGAGWRPWPLLVLKAQFDGHTALYASDLRPLGPSLQLTLGGTLDWGHTALDIGVGEDLAVDTAPDVVFHLSLRHRL